MAVTNARQEWGYMRGFILRSHQAIGVLTLAIVCLAATALLLWGEHLDPKKLECYALGLLLVPIISLGALRGAMLRGLRKLIYGQLPERVIRPLLFLVLIVSLWLLLGRSFFQPSNVLLLQIVSATLAFGAGIYYFLKFKPAQLAGAVPHYRTALWLKSSIPFGLTTALTTINGQTDILALGMFGSDADVGTYRVAVQLATLIIFGLQVVNGIQSPHVAHMYASGDMPRLHKLIARSSQAVLLFALPVMLVLVVFGKPIIALAFGKEFEGAYLPLVILSVGQLVNATMGSVGLLLNMTGHEHDTMTSVLVGAVINVVLCFTLIPILGMIGAALATAVTLVVWNVLMWFKVRRRLGIEPSALIGRIKKRPPDG
jgi:O-antigen/teichoic acid export membrane protein